ncbi:MAG: 3-dehydroquinate synthase [Magnetococcales bacterium]|nr:3-dehydroquinate synthase [Magnetococcales bacterium]
MQTKHTLPLELGSRSYNILIGNDLFSGLDKALSSILTGRQVAVVSNTTVAPLYLDRLLSVLRRGGFSVLPIILEDGEEHKNWTTLQTIFNALIENRFERTSTLIALGGGVIGDMTGFAAASYLRGVPFIQIPTTLLAQVDASVGGKTGINHTLGKNLIGAFYQPRMVAIDLDTLKTLPRRELLAGLAEVIKYGIIWDADLFSLLEEKLDAILETDTTVLAEVIHRCCAIKADIVAADEREQGQRALLNLGHTFGHAIETLTRYETYLHGEAVAVGMIMAADLSQQMGLCDKADLTRISTLIERSGLPTKGPAFSADNYLSAMARDKKVEHGKIRYILVDGIGKSSIHSEVDVALIKSAINNNLQPKR